MTRWMHMLLAVCVAAGVACAPAESPEQTEMVGPPPRDDIGFEATTGDPTAERGTDREYVAGMRQHMRSVQQLDQLAQKRAQTAAVRDLAATMRREHQQMEGELQKLAADAGLDVPPDARRDDEARGRLEQLKGAEFDREYMRLVVEHHEDAVRMTEDRAAGAEHEPVRHWAERALPALRAHLERAREIHAGFDPRPLT